MFEPLKGGRRDALYVVCDGMGGHRFGELASQIAVEEIARAYLQARQSNQAAVALRLAIRSAHKAIRQAGERLTHGRSMGTTAVAAAIQGNELCIANVGDSRAYLVRKRGITQITADHTQAAEIVARLDGGTDDPELDRVRHVLTRSLNAAREDVEPDIYQEGLERGDVLVLCSDGLWSTVPGTTLAQIAMRLPPQDAADALVKLANRAGGPDNISVIVARYGKAPRGEEEDTGEMPAATLQPG